ncbi:hypothetical protein CK203_077066 [Vitis vinifera]|uniref:Uncharacterized protein n=1 Tax=Vitis vinifera TaxID=29760 RepID=A0A438DJ43_VITVI|nr:hypothetical protein CK203_077066 [Vitis vinifera]
MPPSYFPLRWESTGDQWWYASPIDWAAANGHYDLVRELLHLDTNLLIKLTSLRRIRRLETVWDDEEQFDDVARCRSQVARKLLRECQTKRGHNSLIRAGYGGWLLYTAASAGDVGFVKELLQRDPLLVFGEGEYGVTDIFYAAARSKNSEVFRLLLDFSISPGCFRSSGEELDEQSDEVSPEFRDMQGSTILHTASGRGQVEIVKGLLESYDIINSTDNQGNTALNVAAYRGYLTVLEETGPQIELMKQLLRGKIVNMEDIINAKNNDGRTALHMAVIGTFSQMCWRDGQLSGLYGKKCPCFPPENEGYWEQPGTSFRISDAEILLYSGIENASNASPDPASGELSSWRLKILLHWPRKQGKADSKTLGEDDSLDSYKISRNLEDDPTPLRHRFSKLTSLPNNKRVVSFRSLLPSPSTKKKFAVGLMHGVIRAMPQLADPAESSSPPFSESPVSSPRSAEKQKVIAIENGTTGPSTSNQGVKGGKREMNNKQSSFNKKMMNQYFCFGAQGIAVENSIRSQSYRHAVV